MASLIKPSDLFSTSLLKVTKKNEEITKNKEIANKETIYEQENLQ